MISNEELDMFEKMHQCPRLSDGSCQKCRMAKRIRSQAKLIEAQSAAIKRSIEATEKYLKASGAKIPEPKKEILS